MPLPSRTSSVSSSSASTSSNPDTANGSRAARQARRLSGRALAVAATLAAFSQAGIAGPSAPLEVTRSIEIASPPDRVWAVVGNFGDMSYFAAVVAKTEIVKGRDNRVGARRLITLKDGGQITETLTARQTGPYRLSYRMDAGPLPVSRYRSTLQVMPAGEGSRVTWTGRFRPAANSPAAPGDGKDAADLIAGIYDNGLAAMKAAAEK